MKPHTKPELVRSSRWSADGPEARKLFELVRKCQRGSSDAEHLAAREFARDALRHVDARARRAAWFSRASVRYGLAFAAALLIAVSSFRLLGSGQQSDALSYRVKSGTPAGRPIEAKQEPVELDFSDGTVVTALPATRARVAETTRRGARFRLDSGRMTFDVVPHPERGSWQVDAGPFQVHVTGTVFMVEWLAAEGSFRVDVTRGHVVVEGAGQRRELGAGDSFRHRERRASAAAPERAAEAVVGTRVAIAASDVIGHAAAPVTPGTDKVPTWSELVASGNYAAVLDAASQRGLQACLEGCGVNELRALADAARLGRRSELAERALLAQRSRFAWSGDAAAAAFLLGRRAEERRDPQAITWYDRYLHEAPRGRFAADALGRKMMLVAAAHPEAAAALAQQYLGRFPSGPYAAHAHSLIEASPGSR